MIKAFNNIYFKSLLEKGMPKGTPGRIGLPVAGDPPEAPRVALGVEGIKLGAHYPQPHAYFPFSVLRTLHSVCRHVFAAVRR